MGELGHPDGVAVVVKVIENRRIGVELIAQDSDQPA